MALSAYCSFLFTRPIQYSPAFQVKENKEKERLERRLLDELYKIFMDSDSFYYSMTYDLTNSVQRQGDSDKSSLPLWKQVWRETHLVGLFAYYIILHIYIAKYPLHLIDSNLYSL